MKIKLDYTNKELKEFVAKMIAEMGYQPLKSYERMVTADDDEAILMEVFHNEKKVRGVTKIIIDTRLEEKQ